MLAIDVQRLTKTYVVPEREAGLAAALRPQVTARLLGDLPIADLTVEDPPIEDVIEQVFAGALDTARRTAPD